MSTVKKTNTNISYNGRATVVTNLKSHANDPFVIKKTEEAKIAVSKLKLPGTNK